MSLLRVGIFIYLDNLSFWKHVILEPLSLNAFDLKNQLTVCLISENIFISIQ